MHIREWPSESHAPDMQYESNIILVDLPDVDVTINIKKGINIKYAPKLTA